MLKFASKFVLEILPSIFATVIGAYIVNHYISAKPADHVPVVAASSVPAAKAPVAEAASTEAEIKLPAQPAAVVVDATAAVPDKAAVTLPPPIKTHEHPVASHERPAIKAVELVRETAKEAAWQNRDRREREAVQQRTANELARAAIERLGVTNRGAHSAPVAARPRDPAETRIAAVPAVRPLPPAINILTPTVALAGSERRGEATRIDAASDTGRADPNHLTPPADIPPLSLLSGLRTDAATTPVSQRPSVADDMVATAKSVFHAVLPK